MSESIAFERYVEYLCSCSTELKIPLFSTVDQMRSGWGLRRFTRDEFEQLQSSSVRCSERWELRLLQDGYRREKSSLADEIEDVFASVPCVGDQESSDSQEAA
jgi:hypothetical protein